MRWHVAAVFAIVASLGAAEVQAQPPPPGYSPYLNLTRPGNPGVNYYALVRPQIEVRSDLQRLQRNTTTLQTGLNQLSGNDLATGHPAGFMYFGGYYPGLGKGGLPARALPGAATPTWSPPAPTAGSRR